MRMNRPFRMISSKFSSKSDLNFTRIPIAFYENVWKKSNILYITYIVVGCVLIEVVYGTATTAVWDGFNQGVCIRLLWPASSSGLKNLSSGFHDLWDIFYKPCWNDRAPTICTCWVKKIRNWSSKINNVRIPQTLLRRNYTIKSIGRNSRPKARTMKKRSRHSFRRHSYPLYLSPETNLWHLMKLICTHFLFLIQ